MTRLLSTALVLAAVSISKVKAERNVTDLGPGLSPPIVADVGDTVRLWLTFPQPLPDGFAASHRGGLDGPFYAGAFVANDSLLGSPLHWLRFLKDVTFDQGNMTFLIRDVRAYDEGTYACVYEPSDYNVIYEFTNCGQNLTVRATDYST